MSIDSAESQADRGFPTLATLPGLPTHLGRHNSLLVTKPLPATVSPQNMAKRMVQYLHFRILKIQFNTYIYVYIYTYMYVCIYIYIHMYNIWVNYNDLTVLPHWNHG